MQWRGEEIYHGIIRNLSYYSVVLFLSFLVFSNSGPMELHYGRYFPWVTILTRKWKRGKFWISLKKRKGWQSLTLLQSTCIKLKIFLNWAEQLYFISIFLVKITHIWPLSAELIITTRECLSVCPSVRLSDCSDYNFLTTSHRNFILVWRYILTISRSC